MVQMKQRQFIKYCGLHQHAVWYLVNSINVDSNGANKVFRLVAYFRTMCSFAGYSQVRERFLVESFWNMLKMKFPRTVGHRNFKYSLVLLGVSVGSFRKSYLQFKIAVLGLALCTELLGDLCQKKFFQLLNMFSQHKKQDTVCGGG